jgi:recombinational DNA repair protein RecT
MSSTALAVIEKEIRGNEVMARISSSLGKPATDPGVLKFINGAIMYMQSKVGQKGDVSHCTKQSIIDSLVNAATVRLPVDNKHYACLVAYGTVCNFQPEWRGYVAKIKEADPSAVVTVGIVYKDDVFLSSKTDNTATYTHKSANEFEDDEKKISGAYVFIKTDTGSYLEKMSKKELDDVRKASKVGYDYIWKAWPLEMYKKTIIRRACKVKFTEAVSELDALDNKMFNDRNQGKERPALADTAALPPEKPIMEAEIVKDEEKKDPAPAEGTEDLANKAEEAKARKAALEAEEAAKKGDLKSVTGLVSYRTKPNGGGFVKYAIEGQQDGKGKDMMFSTKDEGIISDLNSALEAKKKVKLEYRVAVNGEYTNYDIVSFLLVD